MSEPIKLGLLAASRIATQAVVQPASKVDGVEIVAVAARSAGRAAEAAAEWGAERSYGSYQELIDSDVDAVYIATPAALHRQWAVAALEAGKHVLCEKPLASNAEDAAVIADAAEAAAVDGVVAMEAFHWRYHPFVEQIRSALVSGELGSVSRVLTRFDIEDGRIPRSDIRWDLSLGGGALMDLGCYNVQWLRFVGEMLGLGEPEVVSASAVCPVEGVDGEMQAELAWAGGAVTAHLGTSMIADFSDEDPDDVIGGHITNLVVHGDRGTLKATNPLAPQQGAALVVATDDGQRFEEVPSSSTYYHQLVAFRDAIINGEPFPTTIADGVRNMAVIDACYRAAGLDPRPIVADS
ncbi:MAG: Gfo/Idh/MocA family oxidoreductase [Acidimicrobiia bacterium]|nr:Gfo/Idh/MocA family oxidoreductase [Acidimicrobiia bacterium]